MTNKERDQAADALITWFETQDISPFEAAVVFARAAAIQMIGAQLLAQAERGKDARIGDITEKLAAAIQAYHYLIRDAVGEALEEIADEEIADRIARWSTMWNQ